MGDVTAAIVMDDCPLLSLSLYFSSSSWYAVSGATLQVPVEVNPHRQEALAMRWLIGAARTRPGKSMAEKLASELLDASNNTGSAVKKREETHKAAEANRAYASFRW